MDRVAAMETFVSVAECEGFAAAARRLRTSPASVTRSVAALEEHLGARLFHRTTRRVRLTDAGERYLRDVRQVLESLREAESQVAGEQLEPRGTLTVTAPVMFGRMHVAPVVSALLKRHPDLSVRLLLLDRVTSLVDEGIDAALRIGALPDSALHAVRVGSVRRVICGAPRYLRRRGRPRRPDDLVKHDAIGFSADARELRWLGARPRIRYAINQAGPAIAAAIEGRGLVRVLSYQVADALASGALERVLIEHEPEPIPVSVVHLEGRAAPARVRVFVDAAVSALRKLPAIAD